MEQLVNNSIWAIHPDYLECLDKIETSIDDKKAEDIQSALRRATSFRNIKGNVSVLPLYGVITHRTTLYSVLFGTSVEQFSKRFDTAIADNSIGAIVIDVDSAGGSVYGVQELSNKIYKARGTKPIIAVVNSLMASAAYWIGSAADEIVMTHSGDVGSIGVFAIHTDISEAAKNAGIKYTIIRAGEHKIENNPVEPLTDDAKAYLQKQIDERYENFIADVAKGRNTTATNVRENYGKGRVLSAPDALEVGMIDKIGTLQQVIIDLFPKKNESKSIKNKNARLEIEKRR